MHMTAKAAGINFALIGIAEAKIPAPILTMPTTSRSQVACYTPVAAAVPDGRIGG
jgi:hypothetical protein